MSSRRLRGSSHPSTIKTHLGHVFAKLGVSTRAELAGLVTRRHGSAG